MPFTEGEGPSSSPPGQDFQHMVREPVQPIPDPGQPHGLPWVVGCLQQGKASWQIEGLVHVHGRDQLPGHQVAARIARDHQGEQGLVIEAGLAEQGGEAVDEGSEISGECVVELGHSMTTPSARRTAG